VASIVQERTANPAAVFDQDEIRVDGHGKVSGRTKYTADIHQPNMLWAEYTRSPFAYAKIRKIDTRAAKEVAGVKAVLTWEDIGRRRYGRQIFDWPVLCYDTVRFIGDRVAVVAAETRSAAEEAAKLVEVEYEELDAMLTPEQALAPSAASIHPEWPEYHYLAHKDAKNPTHEHPNIQGCSLIQKGEKNLQSLFASAYRVFEHRFETPRQHHGYIEPHSTLVWLDDDDLVHVHTPNKSPYALRDQMAHVIGIPKERIVIEVNAIGGDFGGKGLTLDELPCYFLAKTTGRPVRHVQSYGEELQTNGTRHPAALTLRTAVSEHGKFLAHESKIIYNGGAYAAAKVVPNLLLGGFGTVGYHIPHTRIEMTAVYTNTIPCAHMRSPADVQAFFGWEQHVDIIAHELGIDPIELRLRNVMREGQTAITDEPMRGPIGHRVLETLRTELAIKPVQPNRARGVAFVCRHTGQGQTSMVLSLKADGKLHVLTGNPDQGSGGHTLFTRVIAATLSISPDRIVVRRGTTSEAPTDPGTGASRVTHVSGRAAQDGAQKLRRELEMRSGMTLRNDRFVDFSGTERSFESVAGSLCDAGPIEAVGFYEGFFHGDAAQPADYSFSAFAIDIDLDLETGAVKVIDALLVADVGQIINPVTHQGQLDGGFVYGIGGALMEEIPVDESGRSGAPNLSDYKLPSMMDIPAFRTVLVRTPIGHGPFGSKMAGELSNSGVAPAIANAIFNAAGVRLFEFPLTAERVFEAIQRHGNPSTMGRSGDTQNERAFQ
jgi:CO/xanthine dehydrogenase Mo-binding subunit